METFCRVIDSTGLGLVRFRLNGAQKRYIAEIHKLAVQRDVVGKSRKWGFSTLRLGLGLHRTLFTPGWTFRIIAHRQRTADELNKTIKTLYETAVATFKEIGEDPDYYLVKPTGDRVTGYEFGSIRSAIHVDTASAKGVGQSDRNDDIYATEYSDWDRADDAFSGLRGSQPPGSKRTRFTIDFNAHGTGNDAYLKYTRAKLPHDDDAWNGFTAFFAGVNDVPEWYHPEFLATERRTLGKRYVEVYPSNDEEMWLANELAVFPREDVDGAQAIYDESARYQRYAIGVDCSYGVVGLDYQAAVVLGETNEGIWQEVTPALHGHWPEDVFAEKVHEWSMKYYGAAVVVERQYGGVVIDKLRRLGTENLYRHRHRDKTGKQYLQLGFPTSVPTKRTAISDCKAMLRDSQLAIQTTLLANEMREYEWAVREVDRGLEEVTEVAGAPARAGAHDDLVMALLMAIQGIRRAQLDGGMQAVTEDELGWQ